MSVIVILITALAPAGSPRGEPPFFPADVPANPQAGGAVGVVARKEARDAVLRVVPQSGGWTKAYGDLGIAVLQQVEVETANKLVALYEAGEFNKFRNPQAVLAAIRQNGKHGQDVAAWLVVNHGLLADPDAEAAFCKQPLEIAYDLLDLATATSQLRASRKLVIPWGGGAAVEISPPTILVVGLLAILLLAVLWRKRQPAQP